MNKLSLVSVMALCLFSASCTIVTRGQQQAFQNQAKLMDERVKLNDRQKELLAETLGDNHPAVRIIEQNSELFRLSGKQLRAVFGPGEE